MFTVTNEHVEFNQAFEALSAEVGHALNDLVKRVAADNQAFSDLVILTLLKSKISDTEAYCQAYHENFCLNHEQEPSPEPDLKVEDDD